jgi:hypothetical protein
MRNHNRKRFIITTLAAVAVAGAALLPGVASADGPPSRKGSPAPNIIKGGGTWDHGLNWNSPGATSYL